MPRNQRDIGFVFQNYALFPHLSVVRERGLWPARAQGRAGARSRARVGEVLELVGLAGYERQFPQPALGRRAAARRAGARRRHPARACCCSTSRCRTSTPSCASQMRERDPRPAEAARHHHGLRHARPGRGDGGLRPHRRDEPAAASCRRARAEDLYYRPRDASSSRRSSAASISSPRTRGRRGRTASRRSPRSARRCACARDGAGLRPGDAVRLVLRPEAIEIVRADDAGAPLQGVVRVAHVPRRKSRIRRCACGDVTLQAVRHSAGARRPRARRARRSGLRCRRWRAHGPARGCAMRSWTVVALAFAAALAHAAPADAGRARCTAARDALRTPGRRARLGHRARHDGSGDASSSCASRRPTPSIRGSSVTGVDPFTKTAKPMQPPTTVAESTLDVRVARARFADFPRHRVPLLRIEARSARGARRRSSCSTSACPTPRPSSHRGERLGATSTTGWRASARRAGAASR